ncbi:MAG: DNA-3-methyladenine glycosylase I [Pseudomonadota bacterium]
MATETIPCPWAPADDPLYREYHDTEWGVPEYDDRALFEKLILDGFQAGLSWRTILYKRDNFRKAFDGFEPEKIARYTPRKVEKLLANPGIIRSQSKIQATIGNAQAFLNIMDHHDGGFAAFLWDFFDGKPLNNEWVDYRDAPTKSPQSEAMSKALKQKGFKFCGPVIVYAFCQAVGMINDHEVRCPRHEEVKKLAKVL